MSGKGNNLLSIGSPVVVGIQKRWTIIEGGYRKGRSGNYLFPPPSTMGWGDEKLFTKTTSVILSVDRRSFHRC